jgi:hypothetical protein
MVMVREPMIILAADSHRHSQTILVFCLGDLPGQKLHAFQANAYKTSRLSGIDVFAPARRGGERSASVECT